MSAEILYEAEGLEFTYAGAAKPAVRVETLTLLAGECVLLIGHNGSGKTTLLKLFNDLIPSTPAEGTVGGKLRYRGDPVYEDMARAHPHRLRKDTVYLHQHPYLMAGSVGKNIAFACRARGADEERIRAATLESLAMVGLEGFAPRKRRSLSGGEIQRAALARAIATGAEVLLLDEPTASADQASRALIVATLAALAASGKTVILSSHEPALLDSIAHRTVAFENGLMVGEWRT